MKSSVPYIPKFLHISLSPVSKTFSFNLLPFLSIFLPRHPLYPICFHSLFNFHISPFCFYFTCLFLSVLYTPLFLTFCFSVLLYFYWLIIRWHILTFKLLMFFYLPSILLCHVYNTKTGVQENFAVFETVSICTSQWYGPVSTYYKVHYSSWAEDYFAHTSSKGMNY